MLGILNNWKLSKKIVFAFGVIMTISIAMGAAGIFSTRQMKQDAGLTVSRGLIGLATLSSITDQVRELRIIMYSHLNAVNDAERRTLDARFAKAVAKEEILLKDLKPLAQELTPDLDALARNFDRLVQTDRKIMQASWGRSPSAITLIKAEGKEASHDAIAAGDALVSKWLARSERNRQRSAALADQSIMTSCIMLLVSISILVGIWFLLNTSVIRPMVDLADATGALAKGVGSSVPHLDRGDELGAIAGAVDQFRQAASARTEAVARESAQQLVVTDELGRALNAVAQGDLTARIETEFAASYEVLKTRFNEAVGKLREMIGAVHEGTAGIRTGSAEIAQASEDLARRTESNAASLEETSAALSEIDARLKATAEAATRTVARADQAIATVDGGRAVADEAVQAMGRVSDSAKGIDNVIEGLDKIAFQTRVLAMNAAVEAGRAGDAGKGFAVVADLVSALAMRAEEEAKRARDQLTVTQSDIVTAVAAVRNVDGALANISGDVGEVHVLLGTMASDNQAQSTAITQISASVGSMDQATQQNAAMVEQTSAAARNLIEEVGSLAERADAFKIGNARAKPAKVAGTPRDVSKRAPAPAPALVAAAAAAAPPSAVSLPARPVVRPRAKSSNATYVSPVKALSHVAGGGGAAEEQDWKDF